MTGHPLDRGDVGTPVEQEKPAQGRTQPPYWGFFVDRGRWERLGFMDIGYPTWSLDGESFTGLNGGHSTYRALVAGDRSSRTGGGRE